MTEENEIYSNEEIQLIMKRAAQLSQDLEHPIKYSDDIVTVFIEALEKLKKEKQNMVFQERKSVLNSVDPLLAEEFETFSELKVYHFETLYQVYMANGSGAKDIIQNALKEKLSPGELLLNSDLTLEEKSRESWIEFTRHEKEKFRKDKANMLPRKLRNGWS